MYNKQNLYIYFITSKAPFAAVVLYHHIEYNHKSQISIKKRPLKHLEEKKAFAHIPAVAMRYLPTRLGIYKYTHIIIYN